MPTLTINGVCVTLDCPPDTPLLWAIREGAGLPGTRSGCLVGLCGACTVHLDGVAVRPCSVPVAQAEGRALTTIEGVLRSPLGRALARAWSADGFPGCELCRPGRIMAAAALLGRRPDAPDAEIEAVLGEHVCECGEAGGVVVAATLKQAARRALTPVAAAQNHQGAATVDALSPAPLHENDERIHP